MMRKICSVCGKEKLMLRWEDTCITCTKEKHLKELRENLLGNEITSTECEDEIICPYCGEEIELECDDAANWEEGNYIGYCDWCDKDFRFQTHVSISYSSQRMKEDE
jgi:RNA polymerase subunit RPABC4/transcription elongation factor Spt4